MSSKDFLYNNKLMSKEDIISLSKEMKDENYSGDFESYALEKRKISSETYAKVKCALADAEYMDLSGFRPDEGLSRYMSQDAAVKYEMVPFRDEIDAVWVAFVHPENLFAVEEAKKGAKKNIVVFGSTKEYIDKFIGTIFSKREMDEASAEMNNEDTTASSKKVNVFDISILSDSEESGPKLIKNVIRRAIETRASDIHIEPTETSSLVRFRIDGVLRQEQANDKQKHGTLVAVVKHMCQMNTAEKRIPQDGNMKILYNGLEFDVRTSSIPTVNGEKIVMRLLQKSGAAIARDTIGLRGNDLKKYDTLLQNHSGVILIVGPTGSGKSSTMFTMTKILNTPDVNIMTLEDPVELSVNGVNQIQINEKAGMTFPAGIRAAMRQDPDIIIIGEIRDGITADTAMRAAITGHLVISTLHTHNAVSSIDRLLDIGVEPYLTASGLIGVISQRLVRKLCPRCKQEYTATEKDVAGLDEAPQKIRGRRICKAKPGGCPACNNTGYVGRTGVFEVLVMTPELKRAIADKKTSKDLKDMLPPDYTTMRDACVSLILDGVTSIDEYRRTMNTVE